jgi:hypothetical protein
MEEKETLAHDKAATLIAIFQKAFLNITAVFHPAGLPGEIAGKGSNVAFAARQIMEWTRTDPYKNRHNHLITVMDGKVVPFVFFFFVSALPLLFCGWC